MNAAATAERRCLLCDAYTTHEDAYDGAAWRCTRCGTLLDRGHEREGNTPFAPPEGEVGA